MAQACVGHCESSAFPSRYSVLVASGYRHNVTSVSQCCTISGLRKVRGRSPAVALWGWGETEEMGIKMAQERTDWTATGVAHGPLPRR